MQTLFSTHIARHFNGWLFLQRHFAVALVGYFVLLAGTPQAVANYPNNVYDTDDELLSGAANAPATGIPGWQVSEPYINLWIFDQPLTYRTSYGQPMGFGVAFKHRNSRSNSQIFGLGPSWESSWQTYVEYTVSGTNVTSGTNWVALGGARTYPTDGSAEFKSTSKLSKLYDGSTFLGFEIKYANGARDIYSYLFNVSSSENYAFRSQQIDTVGHTNAFIYDTISNVVRLRQMIDSDNRTNTLTYHGTFTSQISAVSDAYNHQASFGYDGAGKLTSITNVGNLASSFVYDAQGLITNLTTVYGTTSFKATTNAFAPYNLGGTNQVNRSLEITEADGGKQLFLYRDQSTKLNPSSQTDLIPASYSTNEVPNTLGLGNSFDNSYMDARNTFHWNQKQYSGLSSTFKSSGNFNDLTLGDYKIASRRHWLRAHDNSEVVTDTLSQAQSPSPDGSVLGQKVWMDYTGKTSGAWTRGTNAQPLFVAFVLPDTTTRFAYTPRNSSGNAQQLITTYTSGSNVATRTNTFTYAANGVDLIEVRGPSSELISSNAYNSFHQVVTNYNAVNYLTVFHYDSAHRLADVQWPSGLLTTNFYFPTGTHVGWLDRTVDYDSTNGQPLRTNAFTYLNGLVQTSKDERDLTITHVWDALMRQTSKTIPSGTFNYEFDKLELSKAIDPLYNTNQFAYDSMRRLIHAIDPRGKTNRLGYGQGLLLATTNALQQTNSFSYDFTLNQIARRSHDGTTNTLSFNLVNQLTSETDAAGRAVTFSYNNQGLLSTASNAIGQIVSKSYNLRDHPTNAVDANGVTLTLSYDNLGRVLTQTYPDGGIEQFEYSPRGLITYTNRQASNVTRFGYDVLGRRTAETNANQEVVTYSYNAAGDLLSIRDGKLQTTQFGYDSFGRRTSKTNALGVEILRFQYDAIGRLTNRWTLAKGNTAYGYDRSGNLTNVNYAASPDVTFIYDDLNRRETMSDGVGSTTFGYTSFGALRTEDGPWPSDTITYDYHTNHLRSAMTVLQANASPLQETYGFDSANRLQSLASPAGSFTYSYQGAGELVQKVLYPSGTYMTNSYDSVARLAFTKLFTSGNGLLNSHTYTNNVANQPTRQTRTDGSYVDYTYDEIGQLKTASGNESGGTSRLNEQFGYGYDAAWNLNLRTNKALVQAFGSDSRNQLTNVTRSGTLTVAGNTSGAATNVTVNGSTANRYADNTFALGEFSLTDGNNTFTAVAQDSSGRADTNSVSVNLPAAVSFSYDGNGNLTSDGTRNLEYDDENRLVRVSVTNAWKVEFGYDGLGRRRWRREFIWVNSDWTQAAEIRYIFDGNLVVQERDGNNVSRAFFTRGQDFSGTLQGAGGIGGLLGWTQSPSLSPQHSYYHADGSGNVTMLVNANQQTVAKYLYAPFGDVVAKSGALAEANLYRFSSKETHAASSLIFFGSRFYDPNLQRFVNRDPLGEAGGINLFAFAGNRPTYGIDPWGEFTTIDLFQINQTVNSLAGMLLPILKAKRPHPLRPGVSSDMVNSSGLPDIWDEFFLNVYSNWQENVLDYFIGIGEAGAGFASVAWKAASDPLGFAYDTVAGAAAQFGIASVDPFGYVENLWDSFLTTASTSKGIGQLTFGAELGLATGVGGRVVSGLSGRASGLGVRAAKGIGEGPGAMTRLRYEANPKHGLFQRGSASPAPRGGQGALDGSVGFSPNSTGRVGLDANGTPVVFRQHGDGVFHGYNVPFSELTTAQRNALIENGFVNRKGVPLP